MASALGSALIDVLLGEYIEGLDQHQLELDVLNGHLLLQNLSIKASALRRLQLPLAVKAGLIGRVELRIPWATLSSQPTQLRITDLLLLVGPQSEVPWDHEAECQRQEEHKQSVLLGHEKKRAGGTDADEAAGPKRSTFAARLSMRVMDRLQVDISNVVIRYVDSSHGPHPYSITLGVSSIKLRSNEKAEDDGEISEEATIATRAMCKVVHFEGVCITCARSGNVVLRGF